MALQVHSSNSRACVACKQAGAPGTKASAGKGKRKSPAAPPALATAAPAAAAAAAEPEDPDIMEVVEVPAAQEAAAAPNEAAGEDEVVAVTPGGADGIAQPPDRIVSSNAYMLMYKRRNWRCGTEGQPLELPPECVPSRKSFAVLMFMAGRSPLSSVARRVVLLQLLCKSCFACRF